MGEPSRLVVNSHKEVNEEGVDRSGRGKSLKCMTLNAQSLRYKMEECRKNGKDYITSIISVTESWGQEEIGDEIFNIDGYNMYRDDRKGRIGSGTLLYIKKCLGQRRCWPMTRFSNREDYDSSVWCWVTPCRGTKILVGCCFMSLYFL